MVTSTVTTDNFLRETTLFVRDKLNEGIEDPLALKRPVDDKFFMTSYPKRPTSYPLITVQIVDMTTPERLGMQSELHRVALPLEIRVWARTVKERDTLSQQVINQLRSIELDTDGSVKGKLYGFQVLSAVNVDEPGEAGIHSKVITVQYDFILGA